MNREQQRALNELSTEWLDWLIEAAAYTHEEWYLSAIEDISKENWTVEELTVMREEIDKKLTGQQPFPRRRKLQNVEPRQRRDLIDPIPNRRVISIPAGVSKYNPGDFIRVSLGGSHNQRNVNGVLLIKEIGRVGNLKCERVADNQLSMLSTRESIDIPAGTVESTFIHRVVCIRCPGTTIGPCDGSALRFMSESAILPPNWLCPACRLKQNEIDSHIHQLPQADDEVIKLLEEEERQMALKSIPQPPTKPNGPIKPVIRSHNRVRRGGN